MLDSLTVHAKTNNDAIPVRVFPLQSEPLHVSLNCDNSLLAIGFLINETAIIKLYAAESFLSNNVKELNQLAVSADRGARIKQIAWNPVFPNILTVVLDTGSVSMYHISEQINFYSIDKNERAQSVCWSPKGKQLVIGFANGKLIQFKPDLKPARAIVAPPNTFNTSFDVIAVQWLSTYQFAGLFLSSESEATPCKLFKYFIYELIYIQF